MLPFSAPTTAQEISEPGAPCQPRLPEDKGNTFDKINPLATRRAPTATRTPRVTPTPTVTATECPPTATRRPALFNPVASITPYGSSALSEPSLPPSDGSTIVLNGAYQWPAFNGQDFSSPSPFINLTIHGAAAFEPATQGIRLTNNGSQAGATWLYNKYNVINGFETMFSFRITTPGGSSGGDGLAFVIRDGNSTSTVGGFGCGIGYSGITGGVAIEFDTYQNAPNLGRSCESHDDPDDNHVSIHGVVGTTINDTSAGLIGSNFSLGPSINLKDGRTHLVRIAYNPPNTGAPTDPAADPRQPFLDVCSIPGHPYAAIGLLCVFVDDMTTPKIRQPITINLSTAYVGFTSGTGSQYSTHTILSWHIATRRYPIHTIGMYYPRDSIFYLRNSNTQGPADNAFYFGPADYGCSPLAGDWNGDGVDTIGLFCDYNARFYLRDTNNQGFADYAFVWGNPGDKPFAGRWAGGMVKDGVALFRPSNGMIYLDNDLNGGAPDQLAYLGSPSEIPVVGKWAGDAELDSFGAFNPNVPGYDPNAVDLGTPSYNSSLYRNFAFTPSAAYRISIGQATSVPLMGDWGGLGSEGMAVVVGGSYIRQIDMLRSGPTNRNFYYGDPSFRPLAGSWLSTPRATAPPTNTPRPTTVPACTITGVNVAVPFRIQTSLDAAYRDNITNQPDTNGGNYLFILQPRASAPFSTTLPSPARPWLWGQPQQPTQVVVRSITLIGHVGIIPWINANASWMYVSLIADDGNPQERFQKNGYIAWKDANNVQTVQFQDNAACNPASYPFPREDPVPPAVGVPATFVPTVQVFRGLNNLSPAVMGACRFHNGISGCTPDETAPFLTLDIVPAAIEFCIDNRLGTRRTQCDTPIPIPVYAPMDSCVFVTGADPYTAVLEIDVPPGTCNRPPPIRRQIALTHVSGLRVGSTIVNAGQLIGYVCTVAQWTANPSQCGIVDTDAPPHVAIQLRLLQPNSISYLWASTTEYLQFLSRPNCLYDRWTYGNPTPRPPTSPVHGCP